MTGRIRESLATFGRLSGNSPLIRLEVAAVASAIGQGVTFVVVTVASFERGGAGAVGLLVVCMTAPAALTAPFTGTLADRYPRARVLAGSSVLRALSVAGTAVVLASDAPLALFYALLAVGGIVGSAFEPARAALTPELARSPEELTAANVIGNAVDSLSIFIGPAVGGAMLAVVSAPGVLGGTVVLFLAPALTMGRIKGGKSSAGDAEVHGLAARFREGLSAAGSDERLRVILGLIAAQTFVSGVLLVLLAPTAIDLLDMGRSGLGLLNAAVGIGGLLGVLATASLVTSRRLAALFAAGLVLWGLPLAGIAAIPAAWAAFALLGVLGLGNSLVDVPGYTMLQRIAPPHVLGRVFGILESLILASIALGGAVAPGLVDVLGLRGALVATGAVLPVLVLVCWPRLLRIDAAAAAHVPEADLRLLAKVPFLAPLASGTLEALAGAVKPVAAGTGEDIIVQGQPGDSFFMIARGRVAVLVDGRPVRTQGPGEWFGEIALLRPTPRTATVRALEPTELRALPGEVFAAAVSGHAKSGASADAVIAARLAAARPAFAML